MKRILAGALLLILTACGSAGVAVNNSLSAPVTKTTQTSQAYLAFTADTTESIVVTVDGREYRTETIQVKSASQEDLVKMAGNILTLTPGTHDVIVKNRKGEQVYRQRITITSQERKVVKL